MSACSSDSSGPKTASEWLPDLKSLGFEAQTQSQALINGDAGSAVQLYSRTEPPGDARVDLALFKKGSEAKDAFTTVSAQLSALPPGFFGVDAMQEKTTALDKGDDHVSYVTKAAASSGNRVWTDAYRFGDTVAVAFVKAKDDASAMTVRKAIADQMAAK
jgi:hypothetical protein